MRVVPIRACLIVHSEVVSESVARWDWTLSNVFWSVHGIGAVHEQAMEVQRGVSVGHLVSEMNNHTIVTGDSYNGKRPLAVYGYNVSLTDTIGVLLDEGSIEVKLMGFRQSMHCQGYEPEEI